MNNIALSRLVFVPLILITLIGSLFSQTDSSSQKSSFKEGSLSMQFEIDNNFTLKDFQGMNLSAKWQFKKNYAVRVGIAFSGGFVDEKESDSPNIMNEHKTKRNINSFGIDLFSQFIRNISSNNNISFFYGVGPLVGYESNKEESHIKRFHDDTLFYEAKGNKDSDSWKMGLDFVIGAEWFVHKSISLLAEYGTMLYYQNSETSQETRILPENTIAAERSSKNDGVYFQPSAVKFGISVHIN